MADGARIPAAVPATLAARTLALVDIHSESREEQEIAEYVVAEMPWQLDLARRRDALVLDAAAETSRSSSWPGTSTRCRRTGTSPAGSRTASSGARGERHEGRRGRDDRARAGRWPSSGPPSTSAGFLFFPREELAVEESPLPGSSRHAALDRAAARDRARADRQHAPGRLPRQPQRAPRLHGVGAPTRRGPGSATTRSTAPSTGLRRVQASPPHDVEVGGLPFVEVLSVTRIDGGDRRQRRAGPRRGDASTSATRPTVRRRRRPRHGCASCSPGGDVEIRRATRRRVVAVDNAARPAPRGRSAASRWSPSRPGRRSRSSPSAGLDAVNFGPGATRYAHARTNRSRSRRSSVRFEPRCSFFSA